MPVGRALLAFESLQGGLCIGPALDYFDHTRRLISADIVAYNHVRRFEFVVCQETFLLAILKTHYFENMREVRD